MYKRVGFDIDNCLTELDFTLGVLAEHYEKPVPRVEDILDYNLSSVFGITELESVAFWKAKEYVLCEDAIAPVERIQRLYDQFVSPQTEVYIITNRDEKYRHATEAWLERQQIPYKELIMTSGVSKVGVLRELDIEVMVDDKPSLFHEVKEAQLSTKMVCVDYPFNQDVPCDIRLDRNGRVLVLI